MSQSTVTSTAVVDTANINSFPKPSQKSRSSRKPAKKSASRKPAAKKDEPKKTQPSVDLSYLDLSTLKPTEISVVKRSTLRIQMTLKKTVTDIVEIGKDLLKVKEVLPYGNFQLWLEESFDMTDKSARRYMRLAEYYEKHPDKKDILSEMKPSQIGALMALSENKQDDVFRNICAGKRMTAKDIEALGEPLALPTISAPTEAPKPTSTPANGNGSSATTPSRTNGTPSNGNGKTGKCSVCGRELTNPESVLLSIGPECANRIQQSFGGMTIADLETVFRVDGLGLKEAYDRLEAAGYADDDLSDRESLKAVRSRVFYTEKSDDPKLAWALMKCFASMGEDTEARNTMVTFSQLQATRPEEPKPAPAPMAFSEPDEGTVTEFDFLFETSADMTETMIFKLNADGKKYIVGVITLDGSSLDSGELAYLLDQFKVM